MKNEIDERIRRLSEGLDRLSAARQAIARDFQRIDQQYDRMLSEPIRMASFNASYASRVGPTALTALSAVEGLILRENSDRTAPDVRKRALARVMASHPDWAQKLSDLDVRAIVEGYAVSPETDHQRGKRWGARSEADDADVIEGELGGLNRRIAAAEGDIVGTVIEACRTLLASQNRNPRDDADTEWALNAWKAAHPESRLNDEQCARIRNALRSLNRAEMLAERQRIAEDGRLNYGSSRSEVLRLGNGDLTAGQALYTRVREVAAAGGCLAGNHKGTHTPLNLARPSDRALVEKLVLAENGIRPETPTPPTDYGSRGSRDCPSPARRPRPSEDDALTRAAKDLLRDQRVALTETAVQRAKSAVLRQRPELADVPEYGNRRRGK